MPKVVREDIDNLNALLKVTIEKADYEPKFNEELKKYRKKASFKGFRKGKTPLSFVKKMFGKQVLAEIVNEFLQEEIGKLLRDEEVKYLGQPIPPEGFDPIDFNVKEMDDYHFEFEIGKAPEFDVVGVEESNEYEQYEIEVPQDEIDKDFEAARKRHGERFLSEDDILEGDFVKFAIKELDGDAIKEGGWESEFSVLVDRIDSEDIKKELLTKKKDDTIRLNIFEIEKTEDPNYAKKYFLNMNEEQIASEEVGDMFEATVIEASRITLAEVNQEFFDKQFGEGKVTSEEEAKKRIKEAISNHYETQTEAILFRNFQDTIMEQNKEAIPLPDTFLKRWLTAASEENTPEKVEADYDNFADNLRWSLIKGKLAKRFDVKVEEEEIKEKVTDQIMRYMGAYGGYGDFMQQMVERSMQDPKVVERAAEELVEDKLFDHIKGATTIKGLPVSLEEFNKIVDDLRAKDAAAAAAANLVPASDEEE